VTNPTAYELVLRGRASARLLRPLLDDFEIDHSDPGVTRLVGHVLDASHLHGVLAHLTSVGVELVSVGPVDLAGIQHRLPVNAPDPSLGATT
jgi:hypothetical protein